MDGWSGAGQRDYHYSMYNKRTFEEVCTVPCIARKAAQGFQKVDCNYIWQYVRRFSTVYGIIQSNK